MMGAPTGHLALSRKAVAGPQPRDQSGSKAPLTPLAVSRASKELLESRGGRFDRPCVPLGSARPAKKRPARHPETNPRGNARTPGNSRQPPV